MNKRISKLLLDKINPDLMNNYMEMFGEGNDGDPNKKTANEGTSLGLTDSEKTLRFITKDMNSPVSLPKESLVSHKKKNMNKKGMSKAVEEETPLTYAEIIGKNLGKVFNTAKNIHQRIGARTFTGAIKPFGYEHDISEWLGVIPSFPNAVSEELLGTKLYDYPTDKYYKNDTPELNTLARDEILANSFGLPLKNKSNENTYMIGDEGGWYPNPEHPLGQRVQKSWEDNSIKEALEYNKNKDKWEDYGSVNILGKTTIGKPKIIKNADGSYNMLFEGSDPWNYDSFWKRQKNPLKREMYKKLMGLFDLGTGHKDVPIKYRVNHPVEGDPAPWMLEDMPPDFTSKYLDAYGKEIKKDK